MTSLAFHPGSYLGIIFFLFLTGMGLPVPEEVPVIIAGVLAANGTLHPWLAVVSCIFGALVSDCILYAIGRHFGRGLIQRHPWWIRFVTPEREIQVEEMFQRHGLKVYFLARFLVLLRSPLLLAAGIMRVSFLRFFLIDLFSATVVVGSVFGLSYLYGEVIYRWIRTTEVLVTVVVVVAIAVIVLCLWRRWHLHRRLTGRSEAFDSGRCSDGDRADDDSKRPKGGVRQLI
jgi:membrane protein DedA with SNARE-associated domain